MVAILDYGIGNLASVRNAFLAAGGQATITSDRDTVEKADALVVPGVGAFGRAMENLGTRGLLDSVRASIDGGKPFLGICLGLQLLFTESDEGGLFKGLDIIPGRVERFKVDLKVPHIGWNQIEKRRDCPELEGIPNESFLYFVHSYHVVPEDGEVIATETQYGIDFVSAIKKGNIFACQFHPERSGEVGLRLIRNFIRLAQAGGALRCWSFRRLT